MSTLPSFDEPLPPESWPGAGGRRSVAPQVPKWPGRPLESSREPGASWPGAVATSAGVGPASGWPGLAQPHPAATPGDGAADLQLREPAHRVSPKVKPMWMLTGVLTQIVPLGAVAVWMVLAPGHRSFQWPILAVLVVLSVVQIAVSPFWRYRVHRWEVTDEAVYTQSGWFSQERRIAPISRIQTVDAQFGPIERLFGLGTLVVTTASAAGPLDIEGLERPDVERLVADLTRITAATQDDAT